MKHKRLIINIIAIGLMLTGPFLMVLPGPQIISWLGLFLFIVNNRKFLQKFKWYKKVDRLVMKKLGSTKYTTFNYKEVY